MLYQFKCKECGHQSEELFPASDYDKKIMENGRLRRKRCEKCKTLSVYRHIIGIPGVLGGPGGYMSMERYWSKNPELAQQKEAQLETIGKKRRAKIHDALDKHKERKGRGERDRNYGKGKHEERL